MATATDDGLVTIWEPRSGAYVLTLSGHTSPIKEVAFNADGRTLVSSEIDGLTRIWNLDQAGSELTKIAAHEGQAFDAIFNPDGSQIASAGEDGFVKLWAVETGEQFLSLPGPNSKHFPAFSPDSQSIAAANQQDGISIWDVRSGKELKVLQNNTTITRVIYSEDGTKLAAGDQEGSIHIWNAQTGELIQDIYTGGEAIEELLFIRPEVINAWDQTGLVTGWNANTGKFLGDLRCLNKVQIDAEITSDGQFIAVACDQVFLAEKVDVPQYREYLLNLAMNEYGEPTGVAFTPDGSLLAISGSAGDVSLWDTESGKKRFSLFGPQVALEETFRQGNQFGYGTGYFIDTLGRPLNGVDISPDGRYLVTAGSDGSINVLIMNLDELMETIRSRLSRELSSSECQTYLSLSECP